MDACNVQGYSKPFGPYAQSGANEGKWAVMWVTIATGKDSGIVLYPTKAQADSVIANYYLKNGNLPACCPQ